MDKTRIFGNVEYQEALEAFGLVQYSENIVALSELPETYRGEISKGFSTGWSCLNKLLQGLRPGELTIITADTGVGKTTFCTQLLVNCALQDIRVWLNSWEMKPETILRKIASIVLRRPMKFQNFTELENEQFNIWCSRYQIFINPLTVGTSIKKLSLQLQIAKSWGIQVVLLDHLDYLVNSNRENRAEAIDEAVKTLHELSFSLGMHFLLICHPRQSNTASEEIGLHSLKGSSSIKQYADNVLILQRASRNDPTETGGKLKVKVVKNRMFGIEGSCNLYYQPEWDGYLEFKDH